MSHLNRHITTMHADDTMEVSDSKEIKEEPDEQSSSTTANIEEEAPEEAITEPVVEEPKKSSVKKKYKCQFCTESFDERNQLSLHIVSHKESPRKRGRPSKRDTQLRIQKQKEQKRLDKLQDSNEGSQNQSSDADSSNDEDKPLSAFRDMKNDVKTEIDELADGNCTMCDRVITNFDKLRVHLRKHTGEKLASCKICGQNFIQKSQLKRHLMTHCNINTYRGVELRLRPDLFKGDYSEDGKEEPILDTDTQETLVDRIMRYLTEKGAEGVNRFIQVTTTSAIDMFTESESSDSENEQNGSATLASKRRYQYCSVCNAAFLRSDHIIRHMSTHDPSQFDDKCEVCERVFPNRDLLERHRRSQCENVEKQHKCKVSKK
ncbi:zinc finger protein 782-like [Ctenocephalides felis]|uniref:zinc finger protein 782-like n=1 Tax=Ctenocephalides felis TaxID=7515 RepID=UPI000E6E12C3|nr:zinc finger protein 782-like [Ctenocephalides felis]